MSDGVTCVLMGVSGCGKTTVGRILAEHLGIPFHDGDDYHPAANVEKMRAGEPLDDTDRAPWLEDLASRITGWNAGGGAVLACSALKERYRQILASRDPGGVRFIYLKGSRELIAARLADRPGHFMPPHLLVSQFAALEEPRDAHVVSIDDAPEAIVLNIAAHLTVIRSTATVGVYGMGVMGRNLCLNLAECGFTVCAWNPPLPGADDQAVRTFLADRGGGALAHSASSTADFLASLPAPRMLLLMVPAGAVDEVIDDLRGHLTPGDLVIDGGNSHWRYTESRQAFFEEQGMLFAGAGISGGGDGARFGPAVMAGGSGAARHRVMALFSRIAARHPDGGPCAGWMGSGGAGHFVKMVHNGIEYGEMQLIAEAYHFMATLSGMDHGAMADAFTAWNRGAGACYLLTITAGIMAHREDDGGHLIDRIADRAGQKGTGAWAVSTAAELGVPATVMAAGLMARGLSSATDTRRHHAARFESAGPGALRDLPTIDDLGGALLAARIVNHVQGFQLIAAANPDIPLRAAARCWRGGCIIQSALMGSLEELFAAGAGAAALAAREPLATLIDQSLTALRRVVAAGALGGIPLPAHSEALAWLDGARAAHVPANLVQAQRDWFGEHGFERTDRNGQGHHGDWPRERNQ